jgi:GAF domain-containing protein/ligand-binding sensor domain-containing protein
MARKGLGWLVMAALLALACSCASPDSPPLGSAGTALPTPRPVANGPATSPSTVEATAGAGQRLEFRQLTLEDGLSQSSINCAVQDTRGFMWFGTQDGLNRYDGYEFRVYKHRSDDPHSLSASWIVRCYRDPQDNLWFVTQDSVLNRYDPAMDRFELTPLKVEDPNKRAGENILTLLGDSAGRLWIGTYGGGLVEYDLAADHITYYRDELDDPSQTSGHDNKVYTIYEDSAGTLWLGTGEGLVRYDAQTGSFVRYPYRSQDGEPGDPYTLRSPFVTNIYEDRAGRFWIGTTFGGLNELDRETGRFTAYPYSPTGSNSFSGNSVRSLLEDREGKLWVASAEVRPDNTYERLGLERLDPETGEIVRFPYDPEDPCSLSHNAVLLMHEDRRGTLWFHTFAGGVDLYDRQSGCFRHYAHDPDNPRTLSDDSITLFYEDESNGLWLGTFAGGLSLYHPTWTRFPSFAMGAAPAERQGNNLVWRIQAPASGVDAEGHAQVLWVSTGSGLNRWDRRAGTSTFYEIDPELPDILAYAVYEEADGTLWAGTDMGLYKGVPAAGGKMEFDLVLPRSAPQVGVVSAILPEGDGERLWLGLRRVGLALFDPSAGQVVQMYKSDNADSDGLGDDLIVSMFPASGENLWIATASVLDRFDPATETFVHYRHDPDDPNSMSETQILWVYEDGSGVVWSGTNGDGLQGLDPATGTWTHYRQEDGLPNDVVYAVLPERVDGVDAYLWMSTNNGLSRFDLRDETFRNYTRLDGLQSNEFNWQSAYLAPDGEMFFGGVNGLNAFYPDRIWDDPYAPPVYITGLLLANQPAGVGPDSVLQRSIEVADSARLSYRDRVVSFEFAALYYAMPERVQYAYMLEGFDKDWIAAGDRRFVTYTSLKPRDYVFRVKAANGDGTWNELGASLPITVVPPVWATWWFRGLTAALIVGAVAAGYRLRVHGVEERARLLEREVASRTQELAALNTIASVVSASLDLQQILDGALAKTLDVTGREAGGIYLLGGNGSQGRSDSEILKLVAHRGIDEALVGAIDDLAAGEGFSGQVVETGEPLLVGDLSTDPRLTRTAVKVQGYRSVAIAPLVSRGRVLGSIFVMTTNSAPLGEQDLELLTSIAGQVAVAVDNAGLYADTESRLAQITALQETSTAVAGTLELDELLHLIVQQAAELLQVEGGILNLVDWDRNEDEAVACVGCAASGVGYRAPLNRGLSGWIALHNQPVISVDLAGDERIDEDGLTDLETALKRPLQNAAGVPLVSKGQVIGSLLVLDKQGGQGQFAPSDLDLLVAFANQAATAIENARLFTAEQRRAEQFRVIGESGRRITSSLDLDTVLNEVAKLVQRSFGYDHVGIALIEDGYAVYKVGAGELWEQPDFQFRPGRLKVGEEGITGWVAGHGEPLLVADVTKDPRYVWMESSLTRSELALPLAVKDEVIGVLDVQSNQANAFDDSDVMVLQSLADHAAIAIENARLFHAAQRLAEQFRIVSEVARRITSILAVDELLRQMVELIKETFDYYGIGIGLVEGSHVVFRAGAGAFADVLRAYGHLGLQIGAEGLTGWVAETGEPLVVPDVSKDPRYYYVPEVAETRSEICVPLKAKGSVIGVMVTQSNRLAGFDESDLVVLQSLADQAAVAIENARLFDAEQRRAEQFRVISEVGSHVASILTVEDLLEQMAGLVQQAFGYYLVEIGLVEPPDLVFRTRASREGDDQFESFRLPVNRQSITGWVAATGKPLLVPDVHQEPRYVKVTATATRSEMAVPMKVQDKIIGVINVESDRRGGFDESDSSVLQSLANQAAITIENARLYEQAQKLAVMEERQRLARELHDAVTQTLFSASLIAEAVPALWETDREEARSLLAELRQLSRGALAEMRTLLLELRPAALIEANLRDLLYQLGEAAAGRTGVPVTVTVDDLRSLPEDVHVALYRIAQEALNNVVKHAHASEVEVRLRCLNGDDQGMDSLPIELSIYDDGRGFDLGHIPPDRLGLGIIRERAQAIGAILEIKSEPGHGTRVTVGWKEEQT